MGIACVWPHTPLCLPAKPHYSTHGVLLRSRETPAGDKLYTHLLLSLWPPGDRALAMYAVVVT
jgi:hypothetical protein